MSNYEKLKQYAQFKNKEEMDEQVTKYRQTVGYQLNDTDNAVIDYMRQYAVRYAGVFYQLLATIAVKIGKSLATIKRVIKKLVELGIIKRIPQRKDGGRRKGATIYQFQFFKTQNEPKKMSLRESPNEPKNPCESKDEQQPTDSKPYNSLKKSVKDTLTTEADEQRKILKDGLLSKLPSNVANAIKPFFSTSDEIYQVAGTIFRAKAKVDKSVRIEDHEQLFYKSITSVINSWKRAERKEKEFNVFAVLYKAIGETTQAIVNGTAYQQQPVVASQPKAPSARHEILPDWFVNRHKEFTPAESEAENDADFEALRAAAIAKIEALNK